MKKFLFLAMLVVFVPSAYSMRSYCDKQKRLCDEAEYQRIMSPERAKFLEQCARSFQDCLGQKGKWAQQYNQMRQNPGERGRLIQRRTDSRGRL